MIRNFLFHRVSPQRDIMWDPMDVALFERCIKYITRNYNVLLLEDMMQSEEQKKGKKIATISFDDGYKDNIEYAAPILKKYNCKASFYIVTNCIENNTLTWTHILEHTFQYTTVPHFKLDFDFLPVELKVESLPTKNERIGYAKKLIPFLKTISHENREMVLDVVKTSFNDCELPKLMMNWSDVSQLKNSGFYVGSHSVSHHMLGSMTNENDVKFELEHSGNIIKERLGYFPSTISFPINSFNSTTIRLSKAAGYTTGLAVKQNLYNPATDGDFEIPRIELYNEPWWKTQMRITHLLEKIKTTIRYR